jgi:hypothetical protein
MPLVESRLAVYTNGTRIREQRLFEGPAKVIDSTVPPG